MSKNDDANSFRQSGKPLLEALMKSPALSNDSGFSLEQKSLLKSPRIQPAPSQSPVQNQQTAQNAPVAKDKSD